MLWLTSHLDTILSTALVVSEASAAIVQIAFPQNKGVSGILAGAIKILKATGAKDPLSNTSMKTS